MQYHTNTHGPNGAGLRAGITKAISEAQANGSNEILIKTHTLDNLKGAISSVLGESFTKSFAKNRIAKAGPVTVFYESERIQSNFSSGVILAPFTSQNLLNSINLDHRATDVVYIPWALSELTDYITNNPNSTQI